jgi:hypothetical protein
MELMASLIDDAEFNVDAGPEEGTTVATLTLHGDFVEACEAYLDDMEVSSLSFTISRSTAMELMNEIARYL